MTPATRTTAFGHQRRLHLVSWVLILVGAAGLLRAQEADTNAPVSVFDLPRLQQAYTVAQLQSVRLMELKKFDEAEALLEKILKRWPNDAQGHYNLACLQALTGRSDEALRNLRRAVELGFVNSDHIATDSDLASLRQADAFADILREAQRRATDTNRVVSVSIHPGVISNGVALVTASNTLWDANWGVFRVFFRLPDAPARPVESVAGHGAVGDLLREWAAAGTAAGLVGDLYDNHDGGHSDLDHGGFPGLTRIKFDDVTRARKYDTGVQVMFVYNGVVIGNCSMAMVGTPHWRSMPRLAMMDAKAMLVQYNQYVSNHLYFYPEHQDYDSGPDGHGDVYPANTPYVVTSQGSSGSDRPFMDAVACTLAAFRPETKQWLTRSGALMPTVQMIMRHCLKPIGKPAAYLTGAAHPPVFSAGDLDPEAMVRMAHDMPSNAVPPVVQLRVEEEDRPVLGRDYFDVAERERLFDTPCAIARVWRSTQYERRMVVSAARSRDVNGRPVTIKWVLLQGDPSLVTIRPLDKTGTRAELRVRYHARRPVAPGSKLETSRVDIGCFADNGRYYSAPGFVTFHFLHNEKRVYDAKQRIQSVDYADPVVSKVYTDPMLDLPKSWRDDYRYDGRGLPAGWTRVRGTQKQEFTPDGALIVEAAEGGRAPKTRLVKYVAVPKDQFSSVLEQQAAD